MTAQPILPTMTFAWLAVGGVLSLFWTGRLIIPLAAWLAPAVFLHAARNAGSVTVIVLIWVTIGVATAIAARGVYPASGSAHLAFAFASAIPLPLVLAADHFLAPRLPGSAALFVFPLAWATVDLLSVRLLPVGSWGSIAYTQADIPALTQLVSVTGLSGIVFLIGWFAAAANAPATALVPFLATIGVVMALGSLRSGAASTGTSAIRVATISAPKELFIPGEITRFLTDGLRPDEVAAVDEKVVRLQTHYLDATRREARAGASLVVWPEVNLLVRADDASAFVEKARALARQEQLYLMIGMASVRRGAAHPLENKNILITPSGEVVLDHLKSRLVPGWEAAKGNAGPAMIPTIDTPLGTLATAICFEMDFPPLIRQAGRARAELLVVPANDWREIKELHLTMARFRAIENGVTLLRATSSGLSAVVDPFGRIRSLGDDFAPNGRVMVAQLQPWRVFTLYAYVGDLFGWLSVAALVCLAVAAFV